MLVCEPMYGLAVVLFFTHTCPTNSDHPETSYCLNHLLQDNLWFGFLATGNKKEAGNILVASCVFSVVGSSVFVTFVLLRGDHISF